MTTKTIHLRINKSTLYRSLALLLSAAILLAACSPETPTPTPTVVDVNLLYANPWVLTGYGDPENPTVIEEGITITAEFTPDGQINGFSGCNNYSGSIQAAQDGTLTISPLTTTRMACPQGMDQESVYLAALQEAHSFNFSSQGRLVITFGSQSETGQVLIYASSAKPLTGTNWILVSYGDPASPQPAPADIVITAVFSPEGFLSGFSGCNQYNASYTLQDQQITLGPIATTQMACPRMEAEQALPGFGTAQTMPSLAKPHHYLRRRRWGAHLTAADLPLEHTLWT
jgi:heat shock protein HslJ